MVLYDGNCRLCLRWVERLRRRDRGHRLVLFSLHDPAVERRFPELQQQALMEALHVRTPKGRVYRGAGALRYLSRHVPRLWWLVPLMHVPFSGPLWDRLYTRVATNRHDDDGCGGACAER